MNAQNKKKAAGDLPEELAAELKKLFATRQYFAAAGKLVLDASNRGLSTASRLLAARVVKILKLSIEKQNWSDARKILKQFEKQIKAHDDEKTYHELRLHLDEVTIPEPLEELGPEDIAS